MNHQRILFLDHAAVLGGAELCLLDIAKAYRESSQVLLFESGPFQKRLEELNIKVRVLSVSNTALKVRTSSGIRSLLAIPTLWSLARQVSAISQDYDLVFANSQKAFIVAALASRLSRLPLVWYLHDILTAKHFSKLNRKIAIALANRFTNMVLVNSNATGKAFIEAGGKPELVNLLYNGISAEAFDHITDDQTAQLRGELNVKNVPLIGSFSRLSYWKGQHVLLNALAKLPDAHALIVGEALFGEEEYAVKLRIQASELGLDNRVHWLGFRSDIHALMKVCNVIVHTSTEPEPFGRVIVEGQLAQRPVVAAAAGGAVELIHDYKTGRLYHPGDDIALAQILNELLTDPDQAERLAKDGNQSARTYFSLEAVLDQFDYVLSHLES